MSLMKILKSKGPSIERYDTPLTASDHALPLYWIFTHLYDYAGNWQSICMLINGSHKQTILQSNVNVVNYQIALLKSIATIPISSLASIADFQFFTMRRRVFFRELRIALPEYWLVCSFLYSISDFFCIVVKPANISGNLQSNLEEFINLHKVPVRGNTPTFKSLLGIWS